MAGLTNMFAPVSIVAGRAVAAHSRRVVESCSSRKLLVPIVACVTLLGALAANAQQPGPGEWGMRASVLEPLSELALAESNGKLYLMGGYPQSRVTARTVQIYDIATDTWTYGPELPLPNNHGMAASVNGKVYLIGGQLNADDPPSTNSYVNTVYELDPAVGIWVTKAPMPTARSSGFAVVHEGKIYVAGGRLPRGADFAVYDPAANTWEVLPNLPTQRNHFTGAAISGRIHYVGGRQGNGLSPVMTTAHEVFDPKTRSWTTAAPMLRARSGMNGVMARGLFHVWGGEGPAGMFPDHDYYNPQTDTWTKLPDMPIPVHGITGSAYFDGLIWVTGGGTGIGGSSGSTLNQVYRPAVGLSTRRRSVRS
jgi:N-acetylneuraminic acid mutarotase